MAVSGYRYSVIHARRLILAVKRAGPSTITDWHTNQVEGHSKVQTKESVKNRLRAATEQTEEYRTAWGLQNRQGGGYKTVPWVKTDKATKQTEGHRTDGVGGVQTAYKIVCWVKTDKATKQSVGYRTDLGLQNRLIATEGNRINWWPQNSMNIRDRTVCFPVLSILVLQLESYVFGISCLIRFCICITRIKNYL